MSPADPPRERRDHSGAGPVPDSPPVATRGIPESTVARLPVYLRVLDQLTASGLDTVSSGALAEAAGVTPAQLRKDLSHLGSYGTRGVGYDVTGLRIELGRAVGSSSEWPVVLVGVGNLGTALANYYSGFRNRGFRVVALVDPSPELVGTCVHGLAITDLADLEDVVTRTGAVIGVIATPAEAAQAVAERLVRLGVTSILNFAATVLTVPDGVTVRKVDLGRELQVLAYHEHRKVSELSKTGQRPAAGRGMIDGQGRDQARVRPPVGNLVHAEGKDL